MGVAGGVGGLCDRDSPCFRLDVVVEYGVCPLGPSLSRPVVGSSVSFGCHRRGRGAERKLRDSEKVRDD